MLVVIASFGAGCAAKKSDAGGGAALDVKKRAMELYKRGNYEGSIADLKAYLKERPEDYDAQVLLASAYIVTGRTPEAYREAKKAYAIRKNPDVGYQLSLLADKLGKGDEAIGYLKACVEERPKSIPFRTQLADFYFKYKKYDAAIAELNAVLKLLSKDSPSRPEILRKLAAAYGAVGRSDKAAEFTAAAEKEQTPTPAGQ